MHTFRDRLLDLIEEYDTDYTGSVMDLLSLSTDDQNVVIRNLIMFYGVYDTVKHLEDVLNRCTWYNGWFSVNTTSHDVDAEHVYIESIDINDYYEGGDYYEATIIPIGIIVKKGGYDQIDSRYQIDRLILGGSVPDPRRT